MNSKNNNSFNIIPQTTGKRIVVVLVMIAEAGFLFLMSALDVLPNRYLAILILVFALVSFGVSVLLASHKSENKFLVGLIITFSMFCILTMGSYYVINTLDTMSRISTANYNGAAEIEIEPFNVYISGNDFWGDISEVSRSDVNMIMTINPQTRQILLTSIPRDAYITLHTYEQKDKLTHTGIFGIDETTATVEDWLGIEIDYYVRANFNMAMALVNAMDGVDVYSDYAFHSSISKYKYKQGWNYMTGKQALYFARERKSFKDSDQQRIKNQQKVVKAMIKKLTNSKVLLLNYNKLLDAVEGYMQTDMPKSQMSALVKLQLNDMGRDWIINTIAITGHEEMKGTYSMGLERPLTVNITDQDSVKRAVMLINKVKNNKGNKVVEIKDDKSKKNNLKEQLQ